MINFRILFSFLWIILNIAKFYQYRQGLNKLRKCEALQIYIILIGPEQFFRVTLNWANLRLISTMILRPKASFLQKKLFLSWICEIRYSYTGSWLNWDELFLVLILVKFKWWREVKSPSNFSKDKESRSRIQLLAYLNWNCNEPISEWRVDAKCSWLDADWRGIGGWRRWSIHTKTATMEFKESFSMPLSMKVSLKLITRTWPPQSYRGKRCRSPGLASDASNTGCVKIQDFDILRFIFSTNSMWRFHFKELTSQGS